MYLTVNPSELRGMQLLALLPERDYKRNVDSYKKKIKPGKSFSSAGRAGSQTELCLLWILSAHSTNHLSKLLFLTKLQMETSSNFSLSRRRGSRSRVWQQGEGKRESFPGRCKVWAPSWTCEVTSSARGSRRNLLQSLRPRRWASMEQGTFARLNIGHTINRPVNF